MYRKLIPEIKKAGFEIIDPWKLTDQQYIQDIIDSIAIIVEYTKGMEYDDLIEDRKTVDAVVRNLEIIGEAANQMSKKVKDQYVDIPWEKMVSMRNKVIHEYSGIDLQILWQTIKEDLPDLRERIKKVKTETI